MTRPGLPRTQADTERPAASTAAASGACPVIASPAPLSAQADQPARPPGPLCGDPAAALTCWGWQETGSNGSGKRSRGIHMSGMTQRPLVQLSDGAVRGKAESGVWAFLGVPYAAAPFGAN